MKESAQKQKPLVYIVGLTAALAGLLFGLDIGVISGALPFIQKAFGADTIQQEEIVSALLWGAVAGTLASGFISRAFGRKRTILVSAFIFALGSVFCSVATSADILIGVRFFLGLAVGIASFTAPLYLAEIAPGSVRGALISMYQLMITIGIVLAFLSDTYFATYATVHGLHGGHWRLMLGVLVIPSTLMFVGVSFLPESPRWLLLKNRKEHALRVLEKVRNTAEEIEQEVEEIEKNLQIAQVGRRFFLDNRFFRRAVFLGIGLQIVQQLTGINVVMYYAPKIFDLAGFGSTAEQMWGTVLVGTINVLATFIAIAFVDRLGRKPIMYAGFTVMGLAMITTGIMFKIGVDRHPTLAFAAIAALLLFIVGFAMSAGPIIWVLCSEIYPLSGRDFGITCSTATNWIANAIVGMTFLSLLNGFGPGNTFILYGALNAIFIVIFLLFVPETKGVSLERIEVKLLEGRPLRKIGRD